MLRPRALALVLLVLFACKARPALRLTYAVDVANAYGGNKNAAKVVNDARDAVARRLDGLGLGRRLVSVTANGTNVVVDLGALDPAELDQVKQILASPGRLEFTMVDDGTDFFGKVHDEDLPEGEGLSIYVEHVPSGLDSAGHNDAAVTHFARMACKPDKHASETFAACRARLDAWTKTLAVPDDHRIGYEAMTSRDPTTHAITDEAWRTLYLVRDAALTGASVNDADVQKDTASDGHYVSLTFDAEGGARFEKLTGDNMNRRMAIVLDGVVESAPIIRAKISGGHAAITLGTDLDPDEELKQAQKLRIVLRSGAFPAPLVLSSEDRL